MPLLIEATIEGTLHRVSVDAVALEHYWYPYIIAFDAPNFDAATVYGGYCKITFGSISLHPDLFADHWFPPDKIDLTIKYTETTEAAAYTIFVAIAYLSKVDNEQITYDIREDEYESQCLKTCVDYSGNEDVPVPYVIGTVAHAEPVRVANMGYAALYRIDGIDLTNPELQIETISYYDGTHTLITTFNNHGYSNGDTVIISDTKDYNGSYTISAASGKTFQIEKVFDPGTYLYSISAFSNYPIISDTLANTSFDNWTGATCDNWTFATTGTTAITEETTAGLIHDGTSSLKITFDSEGNYAYISQNIVIDSVEPSANIVSVTFYVAWTGVNPLHIGISPIVGPYLYDSVIVYPMYEWQEVTLQYQNIGNGNNTLVISFQATALGSIADGILYVDGPVTIDITTGYFTKVTLDEAYTLQKNTSFTIIGSTAYSGEYYIQDSAPGYFIIAESYTAESPGVDTAAFFTEYGTLSISGIGHAVKSTVSNPFRIYDNGIPITDNYQPITQPLKYFALSAEPVGKVTISGTGTIGTLNEVMTAAASVIGLSYNSDSARVSSPSVSTIITTQMTIIDFISELSAFFSHIAYTVNTTLYLIDCKRVNQAAPSGVALTEFNFFDATYSGRVVPLKSIESTWTVQKVTIFGPDADVIYLLEDDNRIVSLDLTLVSSGTTATASTNKLIDTGAAFITDGVDTTMYAKNYNGGDIAKVSSIDSEVQLTISSDIFDSGDDYIVGERFPSGTDISITPYHQDVSNVKSALRDIQNILMSQNIEVQMPLDLDNWILPGYLITWTDNKKAQAISVQMKVRSLKYDFDNYTVIASGEGRIS